MGVSRNHTGRTVLFVTVTFCFFLFIFFVISSLLPSKIKIERSISIKADPPTVRAEILNFRNWQHWHPYMQRGEKVKIFLDEQEGKLALTNNEEETLEFQLKSNLGDTISFAASTAKQLSTFYNFIIKEDKKVGTFVVLLVERDFGKRRLKRLEGILADKVAGPHTELMLRHLKDYLERDTSSINKSL